MDRDYWYLFLVLILVLLDSAAPQRPNVDSRRHDVYIAGFFPYGKGVENSDTGRGVMPSVKLALDHVNDHSAVLRNYRLHMWWNDTMCNAAVGVKAFFDMMHSGPHKLMLFGAACTHVTDPIAKASKHWHLTQLSYADTHPMFTKDNFPNFFRIVPSENAFNPPRLSLLKEFNWTRVGTIYQNEPRYSLAHNRLVAELDSMGYEVVETQSFTNEVILALSKLKERDTRIILGNFNEKWARMIFCEAYKLDIYGRRYQWIIMGTYSHNWWKKPVPDSNCTLDELELALQQTILTDLLPLSTSGEITVSGITAEEYKAEYDSRRGSEYSRFHGYTYDGIWAVALAIQNVAHRIKYFRRNESVTDFRYRDPTWELLFKEALYNTSFEGVTGPVRFYDNERKASILLKQFQDGTEVKIGEYSAATLHLDLTLGQPLKWIGKSPPKDRTLRIIEHTRVNKTVYAILAALAVCGIIMAIVFLAFNIRYRDQRYIKMSSPHLNNLIIIGCIVTYSSIMFLGLDSGLSSVEAFPYICTARVTTLMVGFSLAFGAMFSKTWRVHSIFTDVKLNKKIIKDFKLFMVVGVLLVIDVVIMTTWQVADPFYRETKQLEPYPHPSSEDIFIIPENEYCASERMTIFVGLIYVYKGILMIFGAFLAWETRHVSIPALNDSRHVGLSVYNVAIMCICGAAVALVLVDHQDALFLIIGVFVMFCTTATLWLVFVPKMLELRRNPGGSIDKRIRATLRPMSKTRRDSSVSELENKMKDVKLLNSKYRKTLLDKESELQMLIRRLGTEAKDLLDSRDSLSDTNRLSVPLLRKEAPSATETSDLTSLCSLSSQDFTSLHHQDSQKKKRSPIRESPNKTDRNTHQSTNNLNVQLQQPPVVPPPSSKIIIQEDGGAVLLTQNGTIPPQQQQQQPPTTTTTNQQNVAPPTSVVDNNCNSVLNNKDIAATNPETAAMIVKKSALSETEVVVVSAAAPPRKVSILSKTPTQERRSSHAPDTEAISERRRLSIKNEIPEHEEMKSCHRRVSVPSNRMATTPKKKPDCGTHVVAKSELWDTGSQHRCASKAHQAKTGSSIIRNVSSLSQPNQQTENQEIALEDASHMHRSVSERNKQHHHQKRDKSPAATAKKIAQQQQQLQEMPTNICNQQCSKLGYFQSTPNVAAALKTAAHCPPKRDKSMYNAASESELLDREILPIFQKLLTERNKSQHNIDYSFGRSCPNISIKCDIVEYL